MHEESVGVVDALAETDGISTAEMRRRALARGSLPWVLDLYYTKVLSLSFMGHVCFVIALLLTPLMPTSSEEMHEALRPLVVRIQWPQEPTVAATAAKPATNGRSGVRRAGREGRAGEREGRDRSAAPSQRRGNPATDREVALSSEFLRALDTAAAADQRGVFGRGLSEGVRVASHGLHGRKAGIEYGFDGTGSRGTGPGNGGVTISGGSIGSSGGTCRGCPGGPEGVGIGTGFNPRAGFVLKKRPKKPANDCLDRNRVRRVLERLGGQARACYEGALGRAPHLSGKITTRFNIDHRGRALDITVVTDSMGEPSVRSCLSRIIERQRFPACEGGVAEVTYPWLFQRTGQ